MASNTTKAPGTYAIKRPALKEPVIFLLFLTFYAIIKFAQAKTFAKRIFLFAKTKVGCDYTKGGHINMSDINDTFNNGTPIADNTGGGQMGWQNTPDHPVGDPHAAEGTEAAVKYPLAALFINCRVSDDFQKFAIDAALACKQSISQWMQGEDPAIVYFSDGDFHFFCEIQDVLTAALEKNFGFTLEYLPIPGDEEDTGSEKDGEPTYMWAVVPVDGLEAELDDAYDHAIEEGRLNLEKAIADLAKPSGGEDKNPDSGAEG